jgi:hypothetical protein
MTQAVGTAMGQAFVALALSVVAARFASQALGGSGFAACGLFLALVSLIAAGLAARHGGAL